MDMNTILGMALTVAGISEFMVASAVLPKVLPKCPKAKEEGIKAAIKAMKAGGIVMLVSALCVFVFKPL